MQHQQIESCAHLIHSIRCIVLDLQGMHLEDAYGINYPGWCHVTGANTERAGCHCMPTLSTDNARHTLALRLIRACLRLESGRLMDFLPDLAEALQFALTSTVTRSSSKHNGQEYWHAAKRKAAKGSEIPCTKVTSVVGRQGKSTCPSAGAVSGV